MPTYVCSVRAGALSGEQKTTMAEAISRIHSDVTGAPSYFVQVVFNEKDAGDLYLNGRVSSDHIWVRGDIRAGRTIEQRQALMLALVQDLSRIAGVPAHDVWIYLTVLEPTDMVEYGHVLPPPGEEQAWFEALPQHVQDVLRDRGAGTATR